MDFVSSGVGIAWLGAAVLVTLGSGTARAQAAPDCWPAGGVADSARARTALTLRSVRAAPLVSEAPAIDGRLDDPVWCRAPAAGDFVQSRPAPGALATLPSTFRVLYDQDAVYVAIRLEDPVPDSLVAPFPRRDDEVNSDWVFVEMDTRFDRRSGFSFGLNPRGIQVDGTWWDDVSYDPAWSGVWQGAAQVDARGWTAEFRIPFSELALSSGAPGAPLTWGINIYRNTPHRGETSNWSPRLPQVIGVVSHFNLLEGLAAPPGGKRINLVPYGVVTGIRRSAAAENGMDTRLGGDARVRLSRSASALLSLHPDFGQVEADPSQVNLTTFETFLPEQRPLFVEGADVFQFSSTLPFRARGTSFAQESPFYSRRVGRAPRISPSSTLQVSDLPAATTVLGAARVSARSASGWSAGLFQAWTAAEYARGFDASGLGRSELLEPLTSYNVARVVRQSRSAASAVGVMATLVGRFNRSARVDSQLPARAFLAGSDGRHRLESYELTGFLMGSRVEGTAPAIGRLRREPRHGLPDDGTHTVLDGMAAQARVAKLDGRFHWSLAGRLVTRGFEVNDAGFQRNANWLLVAGDWRYLVYRPGRWLRRWSVGSRTLGLGWTTAGVERAAIADLDVAGDLRNYWGGSFSVSHEFSVLDPEVLRGGPAFRVPARDRWALLLYSDSRKASQWTLDVSGQREALTGSHSIDVAPGLSAFVTDRLQLGLGPRIGWVEEGWQFAGRTSPGARTILGRLDQREVSLTTRATYAFSPHLTLQWYAQAFLSGGQYAGFSEVRAPAAADPAERVVPIAPSRLSFDAAGAKYNLDSATDSAAVFSDPAFSDRSLHVSLVMRWEYLPGSTLFLVWTQERSDPFAAPFRLGRDLRRLQHAAPQDALQLKVSYWIVP